MFTQNTAEKFRNWLPNPAPYVKEAIDPKNVKEWAELIERNIREFEGILMRKKLNWIKWSIEIPSFDLFKNEIDWSKLNIVENYLKHLNWDVNSKIILLQELNKSENYINSIIWGINNKEQFTYYYECSRMNAIINNIRINIWN